MSRASRFGRVLLSFGALAIFCIAGLRSTIALAAEDGPADAPLHLGEEAILAAFSERVELECDATPLKDVVELLCREHRLAILFDQQSIAQERVNVEKKIDVAFHGIPLRLVLETLLSDNELAWTIQHGVFVIHVSEETERFVRSKVYPVADLVNVGNPRAPDYDTLIDVLTSSISPSEWMDSSGPGPIEVLRERQALVIPGSYQTHESIARLLAQLRRGLQLPTAPPDEVDPNAHLREALEKLVAVDMRQMPVDEWLQDLAQRLHFPFFIHSRAIDNAGHAVNAPMTATLPAIRLHDALELLLPSVGLDWDLRDGVLWITSDEQMESHLVTKVLDVRDLLSTGRAVESDLINGITSTRETQHDWDEVGGSGTVEAYQSLLVVTQTRRVHQMVERLLADIRALPPPPEKPPQPDIVRLRIYHLDGVSAEPMAAIVQRLVEPKSWSGAGGEGTIEAVDRSRLAGANPRSGGTPGKNKEPPPLSPPPVDTDGWLIVRQRDSVHRQIALLLQDMQVFHWWNGLSSPTRLSDR